MSDKLNLMVELRRKCATRVIQRWAVNTRRRQLVRSTLQVTNPLQELLLWLCSPSSSCPETFGVGREGRGRGGGVGVRCVVRCFAMRIGMGQCAALKCPAAPALESNCGLLPPVKQYRYRVRDY